MDHKTQNNDVYLQLWLFPRGLISGQQQVCKYGKNIFNINISKKTRGGGVNTEHEPLKMYMYLITKFYKFMSKHFQHLIFTNNRFQ